MLLLFKQSKQHLYEEPWKEQLPASEAGARYLRTRNLCTYSYFPHEHHQAAVTHLTCIQAADLTALSPFTVHYIAICSCSVRIILTNDTYLIPRCLRGELNKTPTLSHVVHVVVTVCTTCSENTELEMELILLLYTFIGSLYTLVCKHDTFHNK
jgi:hypothetical protein